MRGAALLLACVAGCSAGSGVPGDQLDEAAFWHLVDQTGSGAVEDRAAVMTHLLRGASAARLESWRRQLVDRADELNTRALAGRMTAVCGPQDANAFAADRSWLIAHGRGVFETARDSPGQLATLPDLKDVCDGSGEAFADAATARYSDLGFEPGGEAFPVIDLSPPRDTSAP